MELRLEIGSIRQFTNESNRLFVKKKNRTRAVLFNYISVEINSSQQSFALKYLLCFDLTECRIQL